jgi:hypothetical protein
MCSSTEPEKEHYKRTLQELCQSIGPNAAFERLRMYLELLKKHPDFPALKDCPLLTSHWGNTTAPIMDRMVNVYYPPVTNTTNFKVATVRQVIELIRSPLYQQRTSTLRSIADEAENTKLKKREFCYATWSGLFHPNRADASLVSHSGLICSDLDHLGPRLQEIRECIINDPATVLCFISPSGDGLKVLYEIDPNEFTQGQHYEAIRARLTALYGIPTKDVDKSCKDVSRACFLPCDPTIYVNPDLL